MGDLIGDNDALKDLIAQGPGDLTDTFLATSTLTAALIAGGFSIGSTLRLRGEESSGRAEPLLATALCADVGRPRTFWSLSADRSRCFWRTASAPA